MITFIFCNIFIFLEVNNVLFLVLSMTKNPYQIPWKNCEAHHDDRVTGRSTSSSVGFISGLSTCVLLPQIGLTVSFETFFFNLLWCFLNLLWWWIPYFLDHVSSGDYSLVFLERTWENVIIHSPNICLFNIYSETCRLLGVEDISENKTNDPWPPWGPYVPVSVRVCVGSSD